MHKKNQVVYLVVGVGLNAAWLSTDDSLKVFTAFAGF
jgi:hypothetical protein